MLFSFQAFTREKLFVFFGLEMSLLRLLAENVRYSTLSITTVQRRLICYFFTTCGATVSVHLLMDGMEDNIKRNLQVYFLINHWDSKLIYKSRRKMEEKLLHDEHCGRFVCLVHCEWRLAKMFHLDYVSSLITKIKLRISSDS